MTRIKLRAGVKSAGLSIHILNADEHPPAHAHVVLGNNPRTGPYCKVKLGGTGDVGDPTQPPVLWEVYGLSKADARRAVELVEQHLDVCWQQWRRHHGNRI
ncbi:MAG TPA: hypothetical protein V6D47_14000 [Oscillatoriaceae cyanobacterium]